MILVTCICFSRSPELRAVAVKLVAVKINACIHMVSILMVMVLELLLKPVKKRKTWHKKALRLEISYLKGKTS